MPRQNRVTPFSTLIATPARGALMGNRGCLHDAQGQIQRTHQGQRWLICLLHFKNRHRTVMTPGHYTELFFLDEATALAAGHRPCAECQRARFLLFREYWAQANPILAGNSKPAATVIDAALHRERLAGNQGFVPAPHALATLPSGVFLTADDRRAYLWWAGRLLEWSPMGYTGATTAALQFPARILTPASVVRTLAAGYPVTI